MASNADPNRSNNSWPNRGNNSRGNFNEGRTKKRRLEEMLDNANRQSQLITTHRDAPTYPDMPTIDQAKPRLQMLDASQVNFEFRAAEPSFLEAAGEQINFCSPNTWRPRPVNAYNIKFLADDTSIDALANTLKRLCMQHNARMGTIQLELPGRRAIDAHLSELRRESIRAAHRAGIEPDVPGGTGNPRERPHHASNPREPPRSADNPPNPNVPRPTAGDEDMKVIVPNLDTCANCGKEGHTSTICAIPSADYGSIGPCPRCNVKDHVLDDCLTDEAASDPETMKSLMAHVVIDRANKPQIRSTKYTFFEVLALCEGLGLISDPNKVLSWPWRNSFAMSISRIQADDPILGGKKHPGDFDPLRDQPRDLVADPMLEGKTIRQIIDMGLNGNLDNERFVLPAKKVTISRPDSIAEMVDRALKELGAFETDGTIRSRSTLCTDLKLVKQEEDIGAPGPSAHRDPSAINIGAFLRMCTVSGDREPTQWSLAPLRNRRQFRSPGHRQKEVLDKVRKFYVEPTNGDDPLPEDDPVYKCLVDLHKKADKLKTSQPEADEPPRTQGAQSRSHCSTKKWELRERRTPPLKVERS